jgi:hypothetical protein
VPGIDEFIHIKLLDEEITAQDLEELVLEKQQNLTSETSSHFGNKSFLKRQS